MAADMQNASGAIIIRINTVVILSLAALPLSRLLGKWRFIRKMNVSRKPRPYVAGPITSSGSLHENIHNGMIVGEELRAAGYHPFIPHLYDFVKIVANYDVHWEDMLQMDENWITACDLLVALPGVSKGKEREISFAARHHIPVIRLDRNTIAGNGEVVKFLADWKERWSYMKSPAPSLETGIASFQ